MCVCVCVCVTDRQAEGGWGVNRIRPDFITLVKALLAPCKTRLSAFLDKNGKEDSDTHPQVGRVERIV